MVLQPASVKGNRKSWLRNGVKKVNTKGAGRMAAWVASVARAKAARTAPVRTKRRVIFAGDRLILTERRDMLGEYRPVRAGHVSGTQWNEAARLFGVQGHPDDQAGSVLAIEP